MPEKCGELTERYSLPIVKKESFTPIEVIVSPKGETILDFGQNLTGWVEFDCNLPKGGQIRLTACEILQDGCFYHENLRLAKTEFVYISNGKKAHVRPHFTFYGFRYMLAERRDEEDGAWRALEPACEAYHFTAHHLRSDFDQIGQIVTGSAKVNQLFSNACGDRKIILWTCRQTVCSATSVWGGREMRRYFRRPRAITCTCPHFTGNISGICVRSKV